MQNVGVDGKLICPVSALSVCTEKVSWKTSQCGGGGGGVDEVYPDNVEKSITENMKKQTKWPADLK